ncbi:hypothetical protein EES39_19870 [Streptomyces sp. ADI92-24]|nr:hypothetical protein EES39_19870 [Streptomyces sp. ADI92-24]
MGAEGQASRQAEGVRVRSRDPGAEQRVAGRFEARGQHVPGAGGRGDPVALALEGVRRQLDAVGGRGIVEEAPVDRGAVHVGLGQRQGEAVRAAAVTAQRADRGGVGRAGGDRLSEGDEEARVGAGLHEEGEPVVEHGPGGVLEAHGAAQVLVPVAGVECGGVDRAAGHRGVEGRGGRAGGDLGDLGQQAVAYLLDEHRVRGVVHRDAAGLYALRLQVGVQLVQGFRLAAHDGGGGAVDHGDLEPVAPSAHHRFGLCGGQRDRHHAAASGEVLADDPAAECDDAGAVLQREGPGDAGGRDLSLGVADDGGGLHTARAPEAREGDHDGPQDRLDDVDLVEGGRSRALVDDIEEVPVGEGRQGVGALAHPVGEHR